MRLRRVDPEPESHRFEFARRQRRGLASFENVGHRGFAQRLRYGGELLFRLRRFDKTEIGAGLEIGIHAVDCGLQALAGTGIGARDDQQVRVAARVDCGFDLADHFRRADDLLAFIVPAFLRADLVFDMERGNTALLVLAHAAHHVDRIAVTGVHVGDDRNIHGFDRARNEQQVLGHGQQADVGITAGARVAAAGEINRIEAGGLHQPCGQRVVGAGRDQVTGRAEQLA